MTIVSDIAAIVAEAAAALDGLEVTVTEQPHDAAGAVLAGGPALLVLPPEIEYLTDTHSTSTWTLWAITGTRDPLEAAGVFDALLSALVPQLGITTARPETYDIADRTLPGYTLTLTTEH